MWMVGTPQIKLVEIENQQFNTYFEPMLLAEEKRIPLKLPMPKILCSSIAYNGTFVVVRMDQPNQKETLVHLNGQGEILWERIYNDAIDFFAMMNDKEVMVLNVPESKIDIINLQTKKILQVNHQFLFEDTASMNLFTFGQTRLFCVVEHGSLGDNRLRLTYYEYDNIKENSEPKRQWSSEGEQWIHEHHVERMNNHSKVGWWSYKNEPEVTFSFYDLKEDPNGKMSVVKTKNSINQQYGINNISLGINDLWEIKHNKYMLVAFSNKFQHKEKCLDKNGVYNNNYIIDATLSKDQASMRETKFIFDKEEDGFMYNDQLIDCFGVGNMSVFHTFRHKEGKIQVTPVYYVNNDTEAIIYKGKWESICYASHFFFPAWDTSCIVQSTHDNGDCEDILISAQKVMDNREISLQFLLTLNEDFDDDLLSDAVDLLTR